MRNWPVTKNVLLGILVLFLSWNLIAFMPNTLFADDEISPDTVKKVVFKELETVNFFGMNQNGFSLLEMKLFNDFLNKPSVYVFTFASPKRINHVPDQNIEEAFTKHDFSEKIYKLRDDHYDLDLRNSIALEYNDLLKESRQDDDYFFVIAGATTSRFPIIETGKGLPVYRYFSEICKNIVLNKFPENKIVFDGKTVFSGHRDFWLHFIVEEKDLTKKSYFINSTQHVILEENELISIELGKDNQSNKKSFQLENKERIQNEWEIKILNLEYLLIDRNTIKVNSEEVKTSAAKSNYISGVPNWAQTSDDCGPNSATNLLGYYDTNRYSSLSYEKLIDDPGKNFFDLTLELRQAMKWVNGIGVTDPNVRDGIVKVTNDVLYANNYKFSGDLDDILPTFTELKGEIDAGRPEMYGTENHLTYGDHWMVVVGYTDGDSDYVTVHNSWGSETNIVWNDHLDCTIQVKPGGGTSVTKPSVSSFNINNKAASTTSRLVTLNNTTTGTPTHYIVSESSSFSGAGWLTYAMAPSFTLSTGNGSKTVYFKVKNATGESPVASDSITLNETGGVTGKLHINSASGSVLSGASVTCGGKSTTTGSDGKYTITGITPGNQNLSFSKSGYQSYSKSVTITSGQTLNAGDSYLTKK